jgi:hypothetical protein
MPSAPATFDALDALLAAHVTCRSTMDDTATVLHHKFKADLANIINPMI